MHDQQKRGQRIAVIGAGVVGMATAYHLAERGHHVTVIERAKAPAEGCSFANAGIIAVGHAESWAGPAAPAQMIDALLGRTPSVKISKLMDPQLWRWGLAFLGQCSARAHRENSGAMAWLARHGRQELQALEQATGLAFEQGHDGAYYLYGEESAFVARKASDHLEGFSPMSAEELTQWDPALKVYGDRLKGGLLSSVDSKGDCRRFTRALAQWLEQNRQVAFHYGATVTGFERAQGRVSAVQTTDGPVPCDQVVIAAGVGTVALGKQLGVRPLIYPVKGYSATYPIRDGAYMPARPLVDETNLIAVTRLGSYLRVTAIAEFAGHDSSPNPERAAYLDDYVARHFGCAVELDAVTHWAGLRPTTPSGRPYLGRLRTHRNVWLNAGHGQLGWTMAAGAGQLLAERLHGAQSPSYGVSETARWLIAA